MNRLSFLLAGILCLPSVGSAFVNLNFEGAVVVLNEPTFGFLDWGQAVPGWSHSSGNDTSVVYYQNVHIGVTQWFALADDNLSGTPVGDRSLEGRYSMLLHSGRLSDNLSPWVDAAIWQSGFIPSGTLSVTMQAEGSFSFFVNGNLIPMNTIGGNYFTGDISGYGGTTAEIKIAHSVTVGSYSSVLVDNINFSNLPAVPEPARAMLFLVGLLSLLSRHKPLAPFL